jgi:molybdenum cofactor biosynthesis enzyme MoaA
MLIFPRFSRLSMGKVTIALHDARAGLPMPAVRGAAAGTPVDARGRGLRDLRISVTDRCNFRCTYCMPKEVFDADHPFLPHAEILSFEEIVRFIEFMDVGSTNGWRMDDVIPSAEIVRRIGAHFPLVVADPQYTGEVAERWRYTDGAGEIGVISSVTQAFCATCTRARLSTDGHLYTCLFAQQGYDLKRMLRADADDDALAGALASVWQGRADRYSEIRTAETAKSRKVEMSYIGG